MADSTLLSAFPQVAMAFGYGSGVFSQLDNVDAKDNMLDLLFVVDNPLEWHEENLKRNSSHYSIVRLLGPNFITYLQNECGANIYYNTLVQWKEKLIKYGVISKQLFLDDLLMWKNLYVSGRLHKPVMHFGCCPPDIKLAINVNLKHAVQVALLCLPNRFPDQQLYFLISNLSYAGDFRMIVGENKNKVFNIVKPNLERFRKLYAPYLCQDPNVDVTNNIVEQKTDSEIRHQRLMALPANLKNKIVNWRMQGLRFQRFEKPALEIQDAVLYSLAQDREKTVALTLKGTRSIVRSSSITQSLKGIITAGIMKSTMYSGRKLEKMFRGMLR